MNINIETKELFNEGMTEFVGQNYEKCIELLSRVLEHEPGHRLALTARGSAYFKRDDTEAAIADFSRAIETDAGYSRAYHLRGVAWQKKGEYQGALDDFNKALELDPEYGAAYYSRATLHTLMGQQDLAVEDMEYINHLTERNIQIFANENNVWRSQHLRLESIYEDETDR